MAEILPARASLVWLRKTAKQQLREWHSEGRDARLADAQLALARRYGFSSWRALKAQIDKLQGANRSAPAGEDDEVATFLRHVGDGNIDECRTRLRANPELVNAIGPHPYWGGRPQALHVSIETKRREMFDLLLAAGADVNGRNEEYDHWSPLMLTFSWNLPELRRLLLERGARVGLFEALLSADDDLVDRMLRAGKSALPDVKPNDGSILAFARTSFAIDRLLELGAPPDIKDKWGATPIEAMSRLGPTGRPLVRHMMLRGITTEPQEHARLGDKETLAALVDADPDIARSDAVMMGAVDFAHHELVRWLLSRGANVNARSGGGSRHSALHSAAWNGDLEMVKLLVGAGANVAARDEEHDNTPAGWAEVSTTVSNNPKCRVVAEFLAALERDPRRGT